MSSLNPERSGSVSRDTDGETMTVHKVNEHHIEASNAVLRSPLEMSQVEKQQTVEYTKDGSLDLFGKPAIRSKTGGLRTLPFIVGVQFLSTISYFGVATNLILYLTGKLYESVSSASTDVTNWNGSVLLFSVLGAFLADSYFGRFWTSVWFLGIYFVGLLIATLTTVVPSLKPLTCSSVATSCTPAKGQRKSIFYLALYIQALGFGGFYPCNIAFGADQYDEQDEREKPKKSLFFNVVYVGSSCGGLVGNTFLIYLEQNVSYKWGFGVSALLLAVSVFTYLAGMFIFRHQKPQGNPLARVAQVVVATFRKWRLETPTDGSKLFELPQAKGHRQIHHSDKFRFLDKAAVKVDGDMDEVTGERINPWRLCTVTQVEEVKFLIRVLPIWASNVYYSTLYVQILTLFVEQASTLDLRLGSINMPPASMAVFETLSVCFWAYSYEKFVVPLTRRITGHPRGLTLLQRMGVGLATITCAMVAAAVLEIARLRIVHRHGLQNNPAASVPMSVFWLIPQYFLVGASETFAYVGQYEFFYDQAPDEIRGISSALQLTTIALGNFISSLLVTIVTRVTRHGNNQGWIADNLNAGHIDYFYWLLAILGVINMIAYLFCSSWYQYTNATYVESSSAEDE